MSHSSELVFGAACAAQRVNGEYIKTVIWPDEVRPDAKPSNRALMTRFLASDTPESGYNITEADMEMGRLVRIHFQGLTFKILQGKVLSEFDSTALTLCNRDNLLTNHELGVVCSLPASYERNLAQAKVATRVNFAAAGFIGRVGDKIKLTVEVLRSNFSQQWGVYYVTAITANDQVLFFSMKNKPENGVTISITGTVKMHRTESNQTQLNRVKIV